MGRERQRRRFRHAVDRRPDGVARNLARIREEEERAGEKRRVEYVAPGAPENLFSDERAKGDRERDLPQRNGRRANQREDESGNKESFVDFVPVNRRKDNFYSDTDDHRRYIDRKIVDETVNEAAKEVGTLIAKRAIKAGIKNVVFDRGGYIYHGKVQAFAEAAREAGLEF